MAIVPERETEFIRALVDAPSEDYAITGVDVSVWQGAIDWAKLATKAQFAFIRAGYGNDAVDPKLTANITGAVANAVPFGLYWYVKPDKSWERHADNFYVAWQASPGQLPPVLDIEDNGGLGKSALESWLVKLVNRFEGLAGEAVMIYTSAGFWNASMPLTNWAKNRKLWVANWTAGSEPILPAEWANAANPRTWEFWQWSAQGIGADYGAQSTYIDLNRYHFGVPEFASEYGVVIQPPTPEPEPEPGFPFLGRVTASALNLRQGPGAETPDIGTVQMGDQLPIIAQQGDWYKVARSWVHKNYIERI